MTSQLLRPITKSFLLFNSATVSTAPLVSNFDAADYPTLATMQRGTVLAGTFGNIAWNAYRCWEREKVASLRLLAMQGTIPAAGTEADIAIALLPRFSAQHGINALDSSSGAAIAGSGSCLARVARATLATDSALTIASASVEPFTKQAFPGAVTRALRTFSTITWLRRDSEEMFKDDGYATTAIGQINLDLSFSEYIVFAFERNGGSSSIGAIVCGLDVESQ